MEKEGGTGSADSGQPRMRREHSQLKSSVQHDIQHVAPGSASAAAAPDSSNANRKELGGIPFSAVVHFTNHASPPDMLKPWKVADPQKSTGTGFILGSGLIITNSHVVRHATSLRVERHGKPGNFTGTVLCESTLCDLALVTVSDEAFWVGVPTVKLQEAVPHLDDTVVAVGYPLGAKSVTVTRGVVSNVHLKDLSLDGQNPRQLCVQIDAAINPGNSGGPVFNVDTCEIVGVAFASRQKAEGCGFIIPVPVVQLFIKRFQQTKVKEFGLMPELGIDVSELINPSMRKSCFGGQVPTHHDGCLVSAIGRHSCAHGKMQVGDVLLKIDGVSVSEKGDVEYRGQERLEFDYLITRKLPGEPVDVTVLRAEKGASDEAATLKEVQLQLELTTVPRLVPSVLNVDYISTYAIIGGLVVLPIGRPLFIASVHMKQTRLYQVVDEAKALCSYTDTDEQACVLASVLAHPINVTYDDMIGEIVDKINGVAVNNMKHLVQLLSLKTAGELVIDFKVPPESNTRHHVIFDVAEMKSSMADILRMNKIPHWCASALEDIQI